MSGMITESTTISNPTEPSAATVSLIEVLTSLTTTVGSTVTAVGNNNLMVTDADPSIELIATPFGLTTETQSSTVVDPTTVEFTVRPLITEEWDAVNLVLLIAAPIIGDASEVPGPSEATRGQYRNRRGQPAQ